MAAPPAAPSAAPRERRRAGGLLWQRNFRLFWTGETVSLLGDATARVAMPLLAVVVLHASTFAVTLLSAAGYLPWLLIGLPAGAWVDRLSCRPLMIACDLAAALLYASPPAGRLARRADDRPGHRRRAGGGGRGRAVLDRLPGLPDVHRGPR